jgi:hypothetical protein
VLFLYDCFYFAVFCCYFASSADVQQVLLVLLPFVINNFVIHHWVISHFFFLKAISHLKSEVLGFVIEEMEEENILKAEILQKMRQELDNSAISAVALKTLFMKWDVNGDNSVDKRELRLVFESLHIHLSDEKFKKVVRSIDLNQDGSIDYDEFVNMCYPEHDWAEKGKDKGTDLLNDVEHMGEAMLVGVERYASTVVHAAARFKQNIKSHISGRGSARNVLLKTLHSHNRTASAAGKDQLGVQRNPMANHSRVETENDPPPSTLTTHEMQVAAV